MGYQAAKLLIDMLEGRTINRQFIMMNELIVRESTKVYLDIFGAVKSVTFRND